jgi:hypothetical protein
MLKRKCKQNTISFVNIDGFINEKYCIPEKKTFVFFYKLIQEIRNQFLFYSYFTQTKSHITEEGNKTDVLVTMVSISFRNRISNN